MLKPQAGFRARAGRRGGRVMGIVGLAAMMLIDVNAVQAQSGAPPVPPVTRVPVAPRVAPAPAPAPAPTPEPWAMSLRDALAPLDVISPERLADLQWRASEMALSPRLNSYSVEAIRANAAAAVASSAHIAQEASSYASALARASVEAAMPAIWSVGDQVSAALAPMAYSTGLTGRTIRSQAPASWDVDDPADSLYREARKALSNDSYRRAAELFRKIRDQYPKSTYTPDAPYWEAFALQRLGTTADLRTAMEVLTLQQEKFPRAATRGDANALKTRIVGQLARAGNQQAVQDLIRQTTGDGCPRAQDDERVDALNALAQIDAEKAMPTLVKVLARREPCTQQLRRTAVWLIASKKHPDAASILLNVAKTDPDKEVREQAVFWMANVPTEEATTMLIELAKKNDNLELQQRAIYSLSRSKSPRAGTTIRDIALDPNADVDVRRSALSWYMSGPGKTMDNPMSFLKEVYGKADSREFKAMTLDIIGRQKTDEARAFLVEVAQNSRESMEARRNAISALRGAGATAADFAQIYDRGGDVEVRKQIVSVLGSLRDNAGVDKLLDIARNDPNAELRKQSINYLTRSKDPRALQLLQEIINR